jgi:predicted metallopeptidase
MVDDRRSGPPLILRWTSVGGGLPVRDVRVPQGRGRAAPYGGQPWHDTGPHNKPIDFTARVTRLLDDIVRRCPEWAHIQVPRILIGFTQASSARPHGLQARVTPLRFSGGDLTRRQRGIVYEIQRYFLDQHEYLYLLTFCLPRFLDQDFDSKLVTVFHELHHMSPAFDGDLRRHEGRCHLHSGSKAEYDREMTGFARAYLNRRPDPNLTSFLRLNFQQLRQRHGSILGVNVPRPKLVPITQRIGEAAARHAD